MPVNPLISKKDIQYRLAPNAHEIDSTMHRHLVSVDSQTLIFDSDMNMLELEVGDVLVSGPSEAAPFGFCRQITSVMQDGARTVFSTSKATIDEAFEDINLSVGNDLRMPLGGLQRKQCFKAGFNGDELKKILNDIGVYPFNITLEACGDLTTRYEYVKEDNTVQKFEVGFEEVLITFALGFEVTGEMQLAGPENPYVIFSKALGLIISGPVVIVPTFEVLFKPSISVSSGFQTSYEKGFTGQSYIKYHPELPGDDFASKLRIEGDGIQPGAGKGFSYDLKIGEVAASTTITLRLAMKLWDSDDIQSYFDNAATIGASASAKVSDGQLCFDGKIDGKLAGSIGGQFKPFGFSLFKASYSLYEFKKEFTGFNSCRPVTPCINEVDFNLYNNLLERGAVLSVEPVSNTGPTYNIYINDDFIDQGDYYTSTNIDLKPYGDQQISVKIEDASDPSCHYTRTIDFNGGGGGGGTTYPPPPTKSTYVDPRDGYEYCVINIGGKQWFAENLRYDGAGVCYDNNSSNCDEFGRLYTWDEAMQGGCPDGWHIPTRSEWLSMLSFMSNQYGLPPANRMKSTSGWISGGNGSNYTRFDAKPGGCYSTWDMQFQKKGAYGGFWSATDVDLEFSAYSYNFAYDNFSSNDDISVLERYDVKGLAHSCRCVKN